MCVVETPYSSSMLRRNILYRSLISATDFLVSLALGLVSPCRLTPGFHVALDVAIVLNHATK